MKKSEKAEQTYQKILEVSAKLFYEKGYEQTSIQDILNELKLSRGVVYYYFKSKKEILDTIQSQRLNFMRPFIKEVQGENAREKIIQVFLMLTGAESSDLTESDEIVSNDCTEINEIAVAHMKDPHMILSNLQALTNDAKAMVGLFEEGVRDGSIETEYPLALAETIFMLLNTWLNPVLFNRDFEQTKERFKFLQQALKRLGADILNDKMIDSLMASFQELGCFK